MLQQRDKLTRLPLSLFREYLHKFLLIFRDIKKAKFHLVDLAGSEKAKKTQATGERFKEGNDDFTIYSEYSTLQWSCH